MADSIREQIIELVRERFEGIAKPTYETNLGQNVFVFRDLGSSPFSADELPAVNIVDLDELHEPKVSGRADHHHTLSVVAQIAAGVTAAGGNADAARQVRKCLSDVIKAIGAETNGEPGLYWANESGTKLAFNTLPTSNEIGLEQGERTIAVANYKFTIEYRTQRWNPYEQ